ncbi:MAG TPA: hypothetical protein VEG40_07395 [Gaiellaceae bacterium]|nr:hypothetical protein [Gaiellaceae bacterium]
MPLVLVAVLCGILESGGKADSPPSRSYPARGPSVWARAATDACTSMQDRMSRQGPEFFGPINNDGPLPKVAAARRTWLEIHEDGLRQLREAVPARTGAQGRAVKVYEEMLTAIRGVIPPAARNDRDAYNRANIRMILSIVATRKDFDSLGAGHICDFAI